MQPDATDLYTGLRHIEHTLPSAAYLDRAVYEQDLEAIWYRSWIMVGRSADIGASLDFRVFTIGTQQVLVLRDETGVLRAFHNTCRHRGSQLCTAESGRLKARLLTCPYHAWSYSLRGELVRVPSKTLPEGFSKADYPLYPVGLQEWRGFIFVNLGDAVADSVEETFDDASANLANWPLENLVSGHVFTTVLKCNWKIFWENFNECLHCPGVHRHLSHLVPIYGRGLMARHDDPDWASRADNDAPEFAGGLRAGAETWSTDGRSRGLHSRRHRSGVLMPEEYELARFHRWIRQRHEAATSTSEDGAR